MACNENSSVKIHAILHLMKLGYDYIPLHQQIRRKETKIFENIFVESVFKINNDEISRGKLGHSLPI